MRVPSILLALSIALGACDAGLDGADDLALPDDALAGGQGRAAPDPAIMAALNDPIMVDPQLTARSNADALRPPTMPYSAPIPHPGVAAGSALGNAPRPTLPAPQPLTDRRPPAPATLAALAAGAFGPAARGCASRMNYSAGWAARMPAAIALHPDARVIEAAGIEEGGCALRALHFFAAHPADLVIGWYHQRARDAGYAITYRAGDGVHELTGTKGKARFKATVVDHGGESDTTLLVAD